MKAVLVTPLLALALASAISPASAEEPAADAGAHVGGCVERVPAGAASPVKTAQFPEKGTAGYGVTLVVEVVHKKGEQVLTRDFSEGSETAIALGKAGFAFATPDGGAGAVTKPTDDGTHLEIPLVPLPKVAGRTTLTLPAMPVTVSRNRGDTFTGCTPARAIVVEDPTAQTPEAKPKPNPGPEHQREVWTALANAVRYGAVALALGLIFALGFRLWRRRPKVLPPPPPPRPPWEVALDRLARLEKNVDAARFDAYVDEVNDIVRRYLGDRYGFEGLESTTDEILAVAKARELTRETQDDLREFLGTADLVKFARAAVTKDDCQRALADGLRIVRTTIPPRPAPEPAAPGEVRA